MRSHWIWIASLASAVSARPSHDEALNPQNYTVNAIGAIQALNSRWYNVASGVWDHAWWNSANTLTTLADFASLRLDMANELNIGGYMRNTFTQAQKTHVQTRKSFSKAGMVLSKDCLGDKSDCAPAKRSFRSKRGHDDFINDFYDDEGWWALAMIRSFDVSGEKEYLDAAVRIFEDMQTGLGGPCNGGIFWSKDRRYVNAVANELYLAVAASLANRIPAREAYLAIAKNQWAWFKRSGLINKDNLINDGLDANCKNNGMQTWSYNQGVILGALVELSLATENPHPIGEAHVIAKSAIKALTNDRGILVETDRCELRSGHCGRDGQQFKGVFVRNLRYLHKVAPDDEFKNFIIRNANAIWANNRNDQDMLGVAWGGPFVKATAATQSCALDVIVAAITVVGA